MAPFLKRLIIMTAAVFCSSGLFASLPETDPKFRADDGTIWHVLDNPAAWSLSTDFMDYGVRWAPVDKTGAPLTPQSAGDDSLGIWDILFVTPFLNYLASMRGNDATFKLGASGNIGDAFALGYRYNFDESGSVTSSRHDLGLMLRPAGFLSLGLTGEDVFNTGRALGMGLALRPISLFDPKGDWLTLTADARLAFSGFVFETAGLHFNFGGALDLRGWWNFETSRPGAELSLNLGPLETSASQPSLGEPWANVRLAQAVRYSLENIEALRSGASPFAFKSILVIKDIDRVTMQAPVGAMAMPWDSRKSIDLPALCKLIRQAAADPAIVAVALESLPALPCPAASQELAAAVDALQAAGKKLWVYADSYTGNFDIQVLYSRADRLSLNPEGQFHLHALGGTSLYFKGLLDKVGVKINNFAPWKTKSAFNSFTESTMPPEERAMVERYKHDLEDQALTDFQAKRGAKLHAPAADLTAQGPWLQAAPALAAGLVDAVEDRFQFEAALGKAFPGACRVGSLPSPNSRSWGVTLLAKHVAVVWLNGNIGDDQGEAGKSIGQDAAERIRALRDDPLVNGLILRVDSGGGTLLASALIEREVKATVAAGKPVVVSMGSMAASGAYYLSADASRIFAEPGTITGSIGVTGMSFDFSGLLDKLDIKAETIGTKPFIDPFHPQSTADKEKVDAYILAAYEQFVQVVATGRKLSVEQVHALGEGQIWTGREALKNGLVDELGGLEEAKAWFGHQWAGPITYTDVRPGKSDFWGNFGQMGASGLIGGLGASLQAALDPAASSPLGSLADPALKLLKELTRLQGRTLYWYPGSLEAGGGTDTAF